MTGMIPWVLQALNSCYYNFRFVIHMQFQIHLFYFKSGWGRVLKYRVQYMNKVSFNLTLHLVSNWQPQLLCCAVFT